MRPDRRISSITPASLEWTGARRPPSSSNLRAPSSGGLHRWRCPHHRAPAPSDGGTHRRALDMRPNLKAAGAQASESVEIRAAPNDALERDPGICVADSREFARPPFLERPLPSKSMATRGLAAGSARPSPPSSLQNAERGPLTVRASGGAGRRSDPPFSCAIHGPQYLSSAPDPTAGCSSQDAPMPDGRLRHDAQRRHRLTSGRGGAGGALRGAESARTPGASSSFAYKFAFARTSRSRWAHGWAKLTASLPAAAPTRCRLDPRP